MKIDFYEDIICDENVLIVYVNNMLLRLKNKYPVVLVPTGEYADADQMDPLYLIYVILENYDNPDAIRMERDLFPLSFVEYTIDEIRDIFKELGKGNRVTI